jgi:hypothetical protein
MNDTIITISTIPTTSVVIHMDVEDLWISQEDEASN